MSMCIRRLMHGPTVPTQTEATDAVGPSGSGIYLFWGKDNSEM